MSDNTLYRFDGFLVVGDRIRHNIITDKRVEVFSTTDKLFPKFPKKLRKMLTDASSWLKRPELDNGKRYEVYLTLDGTAKYTSELMAVHSTYFHEMMSETIDRSKLTNILHDNNYQVVAEVVRNARD